MPPFEWIGEPGWDDKLRAFLTAFGVPLPLPSAFSDLAACEQRIGTTLSSSHRTFLETIGPVALDYVTIFPSPQIRTPDEWFIDSLPPGQRSRISDFVRIADAGGSGNVFTVHRSSGAIHYLSHDPLTHHRCLQSFDDLVRIATIDLYSGYYGWPDEEIEEMAEDLMNELFGFVL